ncbi:MAG: SDR family oxidoreductase [Desulfobacterota bacterium]|nr:SDR family oxidoreductase [Thermodesulfobacteriota bacterium]
MILYVGATGLLGRTAVQELCRRGKPVRCLVRQTSDTAPLPQHGLEIVRANLHDEKTLARVFNGVETVISSFATNIAHEKKVSVLWENDYEGNLRLIRQARAAGVRKFIFISYWGLAKFGNFEHGKIKKLVEDLLTVSGLDYTIFRVTTLATDMSLLLGTTLRTKGRAFLLMRPHEKIRPILLEDLAWCMADALENPKASCRIIEVAGEEEYDFRQLEQLFCTVFKKKVRFIYIPLPIAYGIAALIDALTLCAYNARGLVSAFTGGSTCDITEMKKVFAIQQGSFARYLENYFGSTNSPA